MKKRGFTLAEVLITLGIVGVVAALTAPSLVMSSRNEANAARLSVAVSNLENAFNNAIIQEDADNIYGTSLWARGAVVANSANIPAFVGNLGRYMIVSGFETSDQRFMNGSLFFPMTNAGGTDTAHGMQHLPGGGGRGVFPIVSKNGITYYIRTFVHTQNEINAGREAGIAAGSSYYTNAADIFIDVNGTARPNTFGRDIFGFQLGENGILYPLGGTDINVQEGGGTWNRAGSGIYACTEADKGSDADSRGFGCTARVIAEGYRINY